MQSVRNIEQGMEGGGFFYLIEIELKIQVLVLSQIFLQCRDCKGLSHRNDEIIVPSGYL